MSLTAHPDPLQLEKLRLLVEHQRNGALSGNWGNSVITSHTTAGRKYFGEDVTIAVTAGIALPSPLFALGLRLDMAGVYIALSQKIWACRKLGDTMTVFLTHEGKHVLIEDNADMFPSDVLLTKLKLLVTK